MPSTKTQDRPKSKKGRRRKQPKQARSSSLVEAMLDAAVQVLTKEGAGRFTTARVAERAGVSVGSLYQYFPNKAAILFRLQSDEWRRTSALSRSILEEAPEVFEAIEASLDTIAVSVGGGIVRDGDLAGAI